MGEPRQLLESTRQQAHDDTPQNYGRDQEIRRDALQVAGTAFVVLFCIVGVALLCAIALLGLSGGRIVA